MYRAKAVVMPSLKGISDAEHEYLRNKAIVDKKYWETFPPEDKLLITRFKKQVKSYYYYQQLRRCCYCSFELPKHQMTFDLEHILDQSTFRSFVFELNNFGAACKRCNTAKSNTDVLAVPNTITSVPNLSSEYLVVHPHLDEWEEHFEIDKYSRVLPKEESRKGKFTFILCKIHELNSLRLSDYFGSHHSRTAEQWVTKFSSVTDTNQKEKHLELLVKLVQKFNLTKAQPIIDILRREL